MRATNAGLAQLNGDELRGPGGAEASSRGSLFGSIGRCNTPGKASGIGGLELGGCRLLKTSCDWYGESTNKTPSHKGLVLYPEDPFRGSPSHLTNANEFLDVSFLVRLPILGVFFQGELRGSIFFRGKGTLVKNMDLPGISSTRSNPALAET